jgi:hypothetical protein
MSKQESIADFKQRIALLMRNREGGKQYSIIGAARPDPCVVRCKHTNKDWINKARGNFRCLDCGFQYHLDNPKLHGILEK